VTTAEHPAPSPAAAPGAPARRDGTLAVSTCERCGYSQLAERRCDRCHGTTSREEIAASGAVLAATVVERVPEDVVLDAPFAMTLVQLDGGPQVLAVALGRAHFEPGARVTVHEERVERGDAGVVAHVVHQATDAPSAPGAPVPPARAAWRGEQPASRGAARSASTAGSETA